VAGNGQAAGGGCGGACACAKIKGAEKGSLRGGVQRPLKGRCSEGEERGSSNGRHHVEFKGGGGGSGLLRHVARRREGLAPAACGSGGGGQRSAKIGDCAQLGSGWRVGGRRPAAGWSHKAAARRVHERRSRVVAARCERGSRDHRHVGSRATIMGGGKIFFLHSKFK
jgi:hypothetical protein